MAVRFLLGCLHTTQSRTNRMSRQPFILYWTVILCSIGAAVQGWDQTGSNGANLSWPADFNVSDSDTGKNACVGRSSGTLVT